MNLPLNPAAAGLKLRFAEKKRELFARSVFEEKFHSDFHVRQPARD